MSPTPTQLDEPSFKLSEQLDAMPPLPSALDWTVFASADATPFSAMATAAREAHAARTVPPPAQLSAPSALRQLVAAHRAAILDPVLSAFRLPADLAALSSDEEADPEELRRAREREKIRELKKRRIEGDVALAGLGLRTSVAGVFIRRDQEDESAEVDISMASDAPTTSVASLPLVTPVERGASTRERRGSRRAQENAKNEEAAAMVKAMAMAKTQAKLRAEPGENEEEPAAPSTEEPPLGKNGKAKSGTYKQAWSVSEQHLLERLLEEIPDGEKNRCVKTLVETNRGVVRLTGRTVLQVAQNLEGDERSSHCAAGGEPRAKVLREAEEVRDRGHAREQQARCLDLRALTIVLL